MKKNFLKPILVLTAICLVVAGAIALVNSVTYPVIAVARAERARAIMIDIIPQAEDFEPIESDNLPPSIVEAYRATDDLGYIIIVATNGFNENMRIICGIDNDGNIIEVRTLQHNETRGLGDFIEHESFTAQFSGKDSDVLAEIDSITGATITFDAFVNAVEMALDAFAIIRG
jgi:electron transport complex protein RnfG